MFVHRHSDGKEQFDRVMAAVRGSPELVALGRDGRGQERFTSRTMIDTEQRLERCTTNLAERRHYGVARRDRALALARAAARGMTRSPEPGGALEQWPEAKGLSARLG